MGHLGELTIRAGARADGGGDGRDRLQHRPLQELLVHLLPCGGPSANEKLFLINF